MKREGGKEKGGGRSERGRRSDRRWVWEEGGYFMLVTAVVFHEPMFTQSALENAGFCFMQV